MNKAYSNKALPAGTVLREWRLEEVLGVGGFGIVYKGRGIYFDELVAIKEYFPSSISERDEEDTVVPIDSDAEEVHALGLKKFVEEAKLLWNLSTPSRHPNIVSVRSLFEIHGTAYMVMDFEDGVSLSRMLKDGHRFNERSLWDMVRPIAEGLERAHRVGVLHRDIKPPNILMTPEGRPVLIDFGSARFDTAEATSTKVTFHTPPYAAIEQYVKTYEQGPWTDIYALGVVLYECVTGKKPPEVLERLHGGLGEPLASGKWPGFHKSFLAAVDSAMTIKPADRPQSISDWLAQFDEFQSSDTDDTETDDEKTRFYAHEVAAEEIVPVAPPADAPTGEPIATNVPGDPSLAQFKRAGHDTKTGKRVAVPEAVEAPKPPPVEPPKAEPQLAEPVPSKKAQAKPSAYKPKVLAGRKMQYGMAAAAAGVLLLGAGGWALLGREKAPQVASIDTAPLGSSTEAVLGPTQSADGLATALATLASEARTAGAPASAVDPLASAGERLTQAQSKLQQLRTNPAQSAAAAALEKQMARFAVGANKAFSKALLDDALAKAGQLAAALPWANALTPASVGTSSSEQRFVAATLRARLADLRSSFQSANAASDPQMALAAARDTLGKSQAFGSVVAAARSARAMPAQPQVTVARAPNAAADARTTPGVTPTARALAVAPAKAPAASDSRSSGVSAAKMSQFNAVVAEGRGMARQVIRADRGANAQLARNYDKYLVTLKDSMRGVTSDAQADQLIAQARQTRAYLQFLVKQSS